MPEMTIEYDEPDYTETIEAASLTYDGIVITVDRESNEVVRVTSTDPSLNQVFPTWDEAMDYAREQIVVAGRILNAQAAARFEIHTEAQRVRQEQRADREMLVVPLTPDPTPVY